MMFCDYIIFWYRHRKEAPLKPTERIEGGIIIDVSSSFKGTTKRVKKRHKAR